jgi:hypothetical protein
VVRSQVCVPAILEMCVIFSFFGVSDIYPWGSWVLVIIYFFRVIRLSDIPWSHQHIRNYKPLRVLYFLDAVKSLTLSLFLWRLNLQGSLPLTVIHWALIDRNSFLSGFYAFFEGYWPLRIFRFVAVRSKFYPCIMGDTTIL